MPATNLSKLVCLKSQDEKVRPVRVAHPCVMFLGQGVRSGDGSTVTWRDFDILAPRRFCVFLFVCGTVDTAQVQQCTACSSILC